MVKETAAVGRAVCNNTVATPSVPAGKVVAWVPVKVPGVPVRIVVYMIEAVGAAVCSKTVATPLVPTGKVVVCVPINVPGMPVRIVA